jgi:hypothetical protein
VKNLASLTASPAAQSIKIGLSNRGVHPRLPAISASRGFASLEHLLPSCSFATTIDPLAVVLAISGVGRLQPGR